MLLIVFKLIHKLEMIYGFRIYGFGIKVNFEIMDNAFTKLTQQALLKLRF